MSNQNLTVSTNTAHPYRPNVNQDAKEIADGVSEKIQQAVHQSLLDTASKQDAKIRRSLEGKHSAKVLDSLAGAALSALADQAKAGDAQVTANSGQQAQLMADITQLPKE